MSDAVGEQERWSQFQSPPPPKNNPSTNEEEDTAMDPVVTKKDSNDWKPDKPTMGGLIKIRKDYDMPWTGNKHKLD